ncbi:MAG: cytochrome c nitrite reductase small subunit [Anaerolineae bacterium]|nr:cytochrome c nitrite reductase small subunit [Anaerolineae bacterium]
MAENSPKPRFNPSSTTFWGFAIAAILGVLLGEGVFTFNYAKGTSYFSDDPTSCANCHVMRDQYQAWQHSSHARVATCNTCHTPHDIVGKYFVKGLNGFNHSRAFTLGNFPDPIRITEFNARVAQANCVECHSEVVSMIAGHGDDERRCTDCHGSIGHPTDD